MSRITLDRDTLAKLLAQNGPVEVCDPSGIVVGQFAPQGGQWKEPRISEAELARREATGGGRTLAEIMTDLRKRAS